MTTLVRGYSAGALPAVTDFTSTASRFPPVR
jgi:hypothetical protein